MSKHWMDSDEHVDYGVSRLNAKIAELEARLTEAERLLRGVQDGCGQARSLPEINAFLRAADSASAVQPERCCLDYPRCDCNSPPEPDDDWLCFQRPAQPKVTP